ncbi:vomeronasal type-2 receptor 116-like isoform X1, partial [Sigmodon hispidus]
CQQMNSVLKRGAFTNPVGELVIMNQKNKSCAEYDIYNIWNFPQGFGLKVKIGCYSSYFSHTQKLHIFEYLEWIMGAKQIPNSTCSMMCTPGFKKLHQDQKPVCCFDCAWCPENEVSNET